MRYQAALRPVRFSFYIRSAFLAMNMDQFVNICVRVCIPIVYLETDADFQPVLKLYTWWLPGIAHDRVRVISI